jgi:pimeloyl-ACP methyl ester carboxylesterase
LSLAKSWSEKHHVILVDQRNHGKSPHEKAFNYTVMAEDLAELMDRLNISQASILGHSMGGKTAMKFVSLFPKRVDKLIVVDIGPKYYAPHHQAIIKALKAVKPEKRNSREEVQDILANHIEEPGIIQFLAKNLKREGDHYAWKMNLTAIADNIDHIGEEIVFEIPVTVPTLFISGKKSDYIVKEDKESIKEQFEQVYFVEVKDAEHWVHAEQPDVIQESVRRFLDA